MITVSIVGAEYDDPHDTVIEMWNGNKKVTAYITVIDQVILVNGNHIEDEPNNDLVKAFRWLEQ